MVELIDFHESKFPEAEFTAKLTAMEIKGVGEKETEALVLTFEGKDDEEPIELNIFGIAKIKEDGKISDFMMLGKLINSIRKLGLKPDLTDNKFTTTPSIIGKIITMTPINERKVSGESGNKTYRDWGISKVEGMKAAGPGTTQAPKDQPKTDPSKMTESWKEFLAENLTAPANEGGIIKLCSTKIPDAAQRKPYSDTRKATLSALVKEGFLEIDGDAKYTVKG